MPVVSTGLQRGEVEASYLPGVFLSRSFQAPPFLPLCLARRVPTAPGFCIFAASGCRRMLPLCLRQTQASTRVSANLGHFL